MRKGLVFFSLWVIVLVVIGCGDNVKLPTDQELATFEKAGPILPELDLDRLVASQGTISRYRICNGDLLEIHMPGGLVQTFVSGSNQNQQSYLHLSRVDDSGNVTLPIVGSVPAQGLLLSDLEASIVGAYSPRYTTQKPAVVVRVVEYQMAQVSVSGAVLNPGIYELPTHRMTLVSAIMAAGGIVQTGAAMIHVNQPGETSPWLASQTTPQAETDAPSAVLPLSESKIRLSFQQTAPSGRGIINVKDGDKLLYAEELDVTDAEQRNAVVARVCLAHPQVPADYVAGRLCELAGMIRPGTEDCRPSIASAETPPDSPSNNHTPKASVPKDSSPSGPLMLPVKGMNIPFADIALHEGASVVIEPLDPQVFTVIGLVQRPGVFPYPVNIKYNLLQAISFAGGVDEIANPRYVKVYRKTADRKSVV